MGKTIPTYMQSSGSSSQPQSDSSNQKVTYPVNIKGRKGIATVDAQPFTRGGQAQISYASITFADAPTEPEAYVLKEHTIPCKEGQKPSNKQLNTMWDDITNETYLSGLTPHLDSSSVVKLKNGAHGLFIRHLPGKSFEVILRRIADGRMKLTFRQQLQILAANAHDYYEQIYVPGIVHQDLKPGNFNVHFDENGDVSSYFYDLGFGKLAVTKYKPHEFRGTSCYAAPEQLAFENADPAVDIFALGRCWFELFGSTRVATILPKKDNTEEIFNSNKKHGREYIVEQFNTLFKKDPLDEFPIEKLLIKDILIRTQFIQAITRPKPAELMIATAKILALHDAVYLNTGDSIAAHLNGIENCLQEAGRLPENFAEIANEITALSKNSNGENDPILLSFLKQTHSLLYVLYHVNDELLNSSKYTLLEFYKNNLEKLRVTLLQQADASQTDNLFTFLSDIAELAYRHSQPNLAQIAAAPPVHPQPVVIPAEQQPALQVQPQAVPEQQEIQANPAIAEVPGSMPVVENQPAKANKILSQVAEIESQIMSHYDSAIARAQCFPNLKQAIKELQVHTLESMQKLATQINSADHYEKVAANNRIKELRELAIKTDEATQIVFKPSATVEDKQATVNQYKKLANNWFSTDQKIFHVIVKIGLILGGAITAAVMSIPLHLPGMLFFGATGTYSGWRASTKVGVNPANAVAKELQATCKEQAAIKYQQGETADTALAFSPLTCN